MTSAERSLLITLARIVREDIWHANNEERRWTRPGHRAKFDLSEIDEFRKMMDGEESRPGRKIVHKHWPDPGPAMPETEQRPEMTGYQPQHGPTAAEAGTPPSGGSSARHQIDEAEIERHQQRNAMLCCYIKQAWDVLLDSSKDSDRRVCEAVVVLAKAIPQ